MTVIKEGALQFCFSDSVLVLKYDDCSYYKNQFLNGCHKDNKAVDIIAYDNNDLWLIEIKDFRINGRDKPQPLEDELSQKVRDTLSGLFAARYYSSHNDDEIDFFKNIKNQQNIYFILHIEQRKVKNRQLFIYDPKDIKDKLKRQLKAIRPKVVIVDTNSINNYNIPWSVQ